MDFHLLQMDGGDVYEACTGIRAKPEHSTDVSNPTATSERCRNWRFVLAV